MIYGLRWLRDEDVTCKAQLKDIANFMKTFLPEKPYPHCPLNKFQTRDRIPTATSSPPVLVKRRRVG